MFKKTPNIDNLNDMFLKCFKMEAETKFLSNSKELYVTFLLLICHSL